MHRIIRCSVSWCDGFTDPLLVPHTSWLQPPLPLHIKCNIITSIQKSIKKLYTHLDININVVYCLGVNCGIPIRHIAPTPSAQHVVVIPKEGDAQLWHTMGNAKVQTFKGHQKPIKCLNVNKNPQLLVTGSEDRSVLVWDLNTYALLAKYKWAIRFRKLSREKSMVRFENHPKLGPIIFCNFAHFIKVFFQYSFFIQSSNQWTTKMLDDFKS